MDLKIDLKKHVTKKRMVVGAVSLALVGTLVGFAGPGGGGGGGMAMGGGSGGAGSGATRVVTLEKRDLMSTISATGTVYSSSTTEVYSNLSYPVAEVFVKVGDVVAEGDVLAKLDTASLESSIAQQQASVGSSYAKAQQNLLEAQKDLETYQRNAASGYDSNLLSAESNVASAEMSVSNAELEVQTAQINYNAASTEVSQARQDLRDAREDGDDDDTIKQLKNTLTSKENALETARANVEKAELSLQNAKDNLATAKTNLEAAKVSSDDSVSTYEEKVKSAQLSTDFSDQYVAIQSLQDDLAKCTVTATASGTVTSVNAVVGGSGNGQLFVIQNTDDLIIKTNIQEYDLGSVDIGDRVLIETDATGDEQFEGILSWIAPTSTLTTSGETTTSTDAEYEAEITVSSSNASLRVGMNAILSIIVDERADVYAVPYEAVETEGMGRSYVIVAEENGNSFTAKKVYVDTGMETDLYIEVSGDEVEEGLLVVRNGSGIEEGDTLDIAGSLPAAGEMPAGLEDMDPADMELPEGMERPADGMMGGGPPAM